MDIFASMLQKKKEREIRTSNGLGKNQTTRFVHLILIYIVLEIRLFLVSMVLRNQFSFPKEYKNSYFSNFRYSMS